MGKHNFEMTLNPPVIELFKDTFMMFFEIEILQGKIELLPNGQTKYSLFLSSEKEEIMKKYMIDLMRKDVPVIDN